MKTTILKTLVLFLLITTIYSCGNDDTPIPTPDNGNYFLKVKIDGVDFSVSDAKVSVNADQTLFYTIIGLDPNGNQITLTLLSPTAEGTFIPVSGEVTGLSYQESSALYVFDNGTSTITITENNATYMKGTFSFIGTNPVDLSEKVFTEGSFKAKKI